MMNVAWFKNPDHVAYCKEEEILPKLSRELGINEPVDMGENVWIYMGDLCPAYCLYTPWEDSEAAE